MELKHFLANIFNQSECLKPSIELIEAEFFYIGLGHEFKIVMNEEIELARIWRLQKYRDPCNL